MADTTFGAAVVAAIPETAEYWKALEDGRLLLKYCEDCTRFHYYPRGICPHCHSNRTSWKPSPGLGKVYSFSIVQKANTPYNVAFITLDEGVTLLSCVVDCDHDSIRIDQRVRVAFRAADNGLVVPMFAPEEATA